MKVEKKSRAVVDYSVVLTRDEWMTLRSALACAASDSRLPAPARAKHDALWNAMVDET